MMSTERKIVRRGDIFKSSRFGWVKFVGFDYYHGQKTAELYSSEYRDRYYPWPADIEKENNVELVDL
jgi:hypothetical protein